MEALELGVVKLVVDVVAGQDRLLDMFTKLGFEQEGRLRRHVRSETGETRDLLVLSHFVDELAALFAAPHSGSVDAPSRPASAAVNGLPGRGTQRWRRADAVAVTSLARATLRPERIDRLPWALLAMAPWGTSMAGVFAASRRPLPEGHGGLDDDRGV